MFIVSSLWATKSEYNSTALAGLMPRRRGIEMAGQCFHRSHIGFALYHTYRLVDLLHKVMTVLSLYNVIPIQSSDISKPNVASACHLARSPSISNVTSDEKGISYPTPIR